MKDREIINGRHGESLPDVDFTKLKEELQEKHGPVKDTDVMSAALYPKVTDDYLDFLSKYGPVDCLDTPTFLMGPRMAQELQVIFFKLECKPKAKM